MAGIAWCTAVPKYFIPAEESMNARANSTVTLRGDTAHHLLTVLRMKPGAQVTLCDGARTDFTAILRETDTKRNHCRFEITAITPCATEPPIHITLFQALPKGDKFENIIQKSIELGATEIIPLYTARTQIKNAENKRPRWQKIAESAAGQSMRGIIPTVRAPIHFTDALKTQPPTAGPFSNFVSLATNAPGIPSPLTPSTLHLVALAPSEIVVLAAQSSAIQSSANIKREPVKKPDSYVVPSLLMLREEHPIPSPAIGIWIGSEGGFAPEEVTALLSHGALVVSMGPRVLRTETAGPALLAQLSLLWEGLHTVTDLNNLF